MSSTFYNNSIRVICLVLYLSSSFIYFENKEKGFNVWQKMLQRYLLIIEFEHDKFFLQVEFSQMRLLFFSVPYKYTEKKGVKSFVEKKKKELYVTKTLQPRYLFEERIIEIQFLVDYNRLRIK